MPLLSRVFDTLIQLFFPKPLWLIQLETASPQTLASLLKSVDRTQADKTWSLFSYKDPLMRKIVWEIKYKRNKILIHKIAHVLAESLLEDATDMQLFSGNKKALIIPLPLSKQRQKERGYNQCELIARAAAAVYPDVFEVETSTLKRIRHTAPQTSVRKRHERIRNIHGAFAATNTENIRGRHVYLLDDVTTTGSTLKEARNALRKSGAKSVTAIAIAH